MIAVPGIVVDRINLTSNACARTVATLARSKPRSFFSEILEVAEPVLQLIRRAERPVDLLGQFSRAVNVSVEDHVVAFVLPSIGAGPFHAIVDALPDFRMPKVLRCFWQENVLHLGLWQLGIKAGVIVRDCAVDWKRLRPGPNALRTLRILTAAEATRRGAWDDGEVIPGGSAGWRRKSALKVPGALRCGDSGSFLSAAKDLAGWGPGLTPAGDDVLAGMMLGLWARQGEAAQGLCSQMCAIAVGRTTRLSRAFLQAAAKGQVDARWHALLEALHSEAPACIEDALRDVVSFGSSSGLDMVSGFLWGILPEDDHQSVASVLPHAADRTFSGSETSLPGPGGD